MRDKQCVSCFYARQLLIGQLPIEQLPTRRDESVSTENVAHHFPHYGTLRRPSPVLDLVSGPFRSASSGSGAAETRSTLVVTLIPCYGTAAFAQCG